MNKTTTINAEGKLTRQQLKELEAKEMTPLQRFFEVIIMILPLVCGIVSILEYRLIPDKSMNRNPNTYFWFLVILVAAYAVYGLYAAVLYFMGKKGVQEKLRYRAPLFSALFLLFAFYDYLTIKTGVLTQPFVPCLNFVLNAAWMDRAMILECTIHTLWLLFLGYFSGVALGLVTGITCGSAWSSRR